MIHQFVPPPLNPGPGRLVILTYHDLIPKRGKGSLWFDCTPSELESQIALFKKKRIQFVSLDTAYEHLAQRKPLVKPSVAITFADNYASFAKLAWPILKKNGIPVTMFVHSGYIGNQSGRPKMDARTLKELLKDPLFRAQSQTVSHPAHCGELTPEQWKREVWQSAKDLSVFGRKIVDLAYPNGKYSKWNLAEVQRAGYRMAFSEEWGLSEGSPNLLEVRRYVHTQYLRALRALQSE